MACFTFGETMNHAVTLFRRLALIAILVCLVWPSAAILSGTAHAQTTAAIRSFDEPLGPYGYWVDDPTYGRVWRPRDIGQDWRPYTYGRWVYTSDYGWVWDSEERWGWVVYHYGRWVWTGQYGWVWVAGDVWGPAWVEWCSGNGYIGWTPMAAQPYWQSNYYYGSYDCTSPAYYSRTVYVSQSRFAGASVSAYVVAPAMNARIAAQTINVTNYNRAGAMIANRSIDVAKLRAVTGQPIAPLPVIRSQSPVAPGANATGAQALRIYQPSVLDKVKPKQDAAQAVKPKFDPSTGRSSGEMLGAPGGYTGSPLPSSNAPSSMPGGLGSDGPSLPSAGSLGGAPGSSGGSGGGLLGGRRR